MTRLLGRVACLFLLCAAGLQGQQSRADLVDTALDTADDDIRVGLLIRALDPQLGPPDSLWAVGAFSIAFRLSETGREEQARTWLRWAAREGAGLDLSPRDFPALFPPPLAQAWDQAVAAVSTDSDEVRVSTEYAWPSAFVPGSPGVLIVRAEGAPPGTVAEIEGVGSVALGVRRALEPGTYEVTLTRPDGSSTGFRREVLPGIDRTLTVQLGEELPPEARATAAASLLRLRRGSGSGAVCTSGVAVGERGWFVAPLGPLDGEGFEAVTPDGRVVTGLDLSLRDPELGIGVGRLRGGSLPPLGTSAGTDGPAWALYYDGCGPLQAVSTTLGAGGGPRISSSAPAASAGGAVIDDTGSLIALSLGATALRAADVERAVERARRAVLAARTGDEDEAGAQEGGGGFPVVWVAAGAAAVGVAALLLSGGGGGDDDDGPQRTGIVITWPGG